MNQTFHRAGIPFSNTLLEMATMSDEICGMVKNRNRKDKTGAP
jgi:hypothetical protein